MFVHSIYIVMILFVILNAFVRSIMHWGHSSPIDHFIVSSRLRRLCYHARIALPAMTFVLLLLLLFFCPRYLHSRGLKTYAKKTLEWPSVAEFVG